MSKLPKVKTAQAAVSAHGAGGLAALESMLRASNRVPVSVDEGAAGAPLVAEVIDTHHPHLPGRIGVAWYMAGGERVERWIAVARAVRARRGDRVLMTRPANWPSWVVTAVLEGSDPADDKEENTPRDERAGAQPSLALGRGEALQITSVEGMPLVEVTAGRDGPEVRLLSEHVELDLAGRLRINAERIELDARDGGIGLRTDGEAIMRARIIKLN